MNAGKSTTLLQSSYNYRERGLNTLLFTPSFDDRYGPAKVTSRIGLQADAVKFHKTFDLFLYTQTQLQSKQPIHCVLVDEAQFLLKQQVVQCCQIADLLKIPVLAYGLRSDFRGEPFPGSMYLLAWAEEIIEIKTICHCGKKATMTLRVNDNNEPIKEGAQVEIGGNERYISVCRKHSFCALDKPGYLE